jgi:TRAP-type mannitol/chloroaromatic compound transport system substrate-binding protein
MRRPRIFIFTGVNLMDRRSLIKHAGIAGVLAAGVAPAVHAQAAIRWRLASSFPKSLDTIYGGAETFAKHVKAMSGGKFEISVHAAGELMPAFGVVDGVQQGSIEARTPRPTTSSARTRPSPSAAPSPSA